MGGTISTILKPPSRGNWLLRSHDSFIFDSQTSESFVGYHTCGRPSDVGATNTHRGNAITKTTEHLARVGEYEYVLNKPVMEAV
jgi:hypothetical protein